MGHYEDIKIDRKDGWKFQSTHGTNGEDYYAKVYVDDNGEISKESYSREYKEKNGKDNKGKEAKGEGNKGSKGSVGKEKEGCLTKIIKAPFRFLWWLIKLIFKNALVILTFGIANGWFDKDDK